MRMQGRRRSRGGRREHDVPRQRAHAEEAPSCNHLCRQLAQSCCHLRHTFQRSNVNAEAREYLSRLATRKISNGCGGIPVYGPNFMIQFGCLHILVGAKQQICCQTIAIMKSGTLF